MPGKIVVVGSSNTDMILKTPRIPKSGETILGGEFSMAAGGKGANQAVAAARAGADVYFIARVGSDVFGQSALDGFQKDNIHTDYVFTDESAPSGVALIFVADDGENCIGVASGSNANLSKEDIVAATDPIASADVILLQLEIPMEAVEAAVAIARENNVKVILNPAPAMALNDASLRCVSVLTPNETEAELLTGVQVICEEDCRKAAGILCERGVETVIITLGSKGAFVLGPQLSGLIRGFEAKAVDTTAAGDVFNGALAVALSNKMPLDQAVTFANAAASLSVTKPGAQPSAPYLEDIERLCKKRASQC